MDPGLDLKDYGFYIVRKVPYRLDCSGYMEMSEKNLHLSGLEESQEGNFNIILEWFGMNT